MSIKRVQPDTALGIDVIENVLTGAVSPIQKRKTPRIRVYTALITQTGTSNPTIQLLQNTLGGNITWARTGVGQYSGATTGELLTPGKTALFIQTASSYNHIAFVQIGADDVAIGTRDSTLTAADSLLSDVAIEIRVYE